MIQPNNTKKQTTTTSIPAMRRLNYGRFIVLAGKKYARASYFLKRDLKLSNSQIIVKGICYYLIEKEEVELKGELIVTNSLAA